MKTHGCFVIPAFLLSTACSTGGVAAPDASVSAGPQTDGPSDAVERSSATTSATPANAANLSELPPSSRPLRFMKVVSVNGSAFLVRTDGPPRTPTLERLEWPDATGPHAHLGGWPMWLIEPKPYDSPKLTLVSEPPCVAKPTRSFLHATLPAEGLGADPKGPPVDLAKIPIRWREVVDLPGCKANGDGIAVVGVFQRARVLSDPTALEAANQRLPKRAVIHTAIELDGRTLFVALDEAVGESEVVVELEGQTLVRVGVL